MTSTKPGKEAPKTGEIVTPAGPKISQTLATFAQMASMLPQADEGDGAEAIVAQILSAATIEDLDAPWRAEEGKALIGKPISIVGAKARKSDYADGLGVFLVVDAVNLETGEATIFTTGSVSVVAQIVKAFCMDALPFNAMLCQSARPTKDGYYPLHLEVLKQSPGKAPF